MNKIYADKIHGVDECYHDMRVYSSWKLDLDCVEYDDLVAESEVAVRVVPPGPLSVVADVDDVAAAPAVPDSEKDTLDPPDGVLKKSVAH